MATTWRAARWVATALAIGWALAACAAQQPAPTATPAGPAPTDAPEVLQAELAALPPGDAAAGRAIFSAAGCVACHSLDPGVRIVGPSLSGVATRAATRKSSYTAQLYIYESITRPGVYVVDGFPNGVMPPDFKKRLKPQELADVIAFLLTKQ